MEKKTCPTCGRSFEAPQEAHRGRPRVYCSQRCREIASLATRLGALVGSLAEEVEAPTVETAALRGAMFRIGNLLNRIGRPVRGLNARPDKTRSGWRGLRRAGE